MLRCLFDENAAAEGDAFYADGDPILTQSGYNITTSHSVVFGNAGGDSLLRDHHDNLIVDPLFCDAPLYDHTYCANSLCLPGNNP